MASSDTTPGVRGGHGDWVCPNFNEEDIERGVGDWNTKIRTTGLQAMKVARESLRALRKTALGAARDEELNFFFADIEHDDANTVWSGSRVLGAGSFGKATLYTGHDINTAQQLDCLVVKEGEHRDESDVFERPGLAREAAILADYNKQDSMNRTNFLRRFAYSPVCQKQRLYLEFCEHGDLYRMKTRYVLFMKFL